jgi:hypothetical protein
MYVKLRCGYRLVRYAKLEQGIKYKKSEDRKVLGRRELDAKVLFCSLAVKVAVGSFGFEHPWGRIA